MSGVLTTGNCFVSVTDHEGQALPGATTIIEGNGAPRVQITDAQGQCRFLELPPGTYSLECQLEGYSTCSFPNLAIAVGRNSSLEVALSLAVHVVIE